MSRRRRRESRTRSNRCPSSCRRKTGYATLAEAKRHAESLAVAMPFAKIRTYKCKRCRKFYVTSEPRRKR